MALLTALLGWWLLWQKTEVPPRAEMRQTPPEPPPLAPVAPVAAVPDQKPADSESAGPPPAPPVDPGKAMVLELGEGRFRVGLVEFDKLRRVVVIPATVLMREGPVEYLLVTRGGKVHEAVLVTDADPRDVHVAALLLGVKPEENLGPATGPTRPGDHGTVGAWLEWDRNGPPAREDLGAVVQIKDPASGAVSGSLDAGWWLYNGSRVEADGGFAAKRSGSLVSIIRDQDALVNHPGSSRDQDDIHVPNAAKLPKIGHPVRVVLELR